MNAHPPQPLRAVRLPNEVVLAGTVVVLIYPHFCSVIVNTTNTITTIVIITAINIITPITITTTTIRDISTLSETMR